MRGVKRLMTAVVVLVLGSLLVSLLQEGGVFGSNRGDPSPAFFGRKALEDGGASAWSPALEAALKRGVAASSVRSSAQPEAGSPSLPHGFDSFSNAKRQKAAMADEGDERVALRAKGRKAIGAGNGGASPPPPPNPSEERVTKRILSIIGHLPADTLPRCVGTLPSTRRPPAVRILNMRSLVVYSRASSFMLLLYWTMYATLTYQNTAFEVASITSTVLSFVTLWLHLVYALWPTEENQDHGSFSELGALEKLLPRKTC